MTVHRTRSSSNPDPKIRDQLVRSAFQMTPEEFALHFTKRHADSLAGQAALPVLKPDVLETYLAFHYRLHQVKTLDELEHHHEEESVESSIDRAIRALMAQNHRGWVELASVQGKFVAVFPDGDIATRIKNIVRYHDTVEEATDTLLHPPRAKRKKASLCLAARMWSIYHVSSVLGPGTSSTGWEITVSAPTTIPAPTQVQRMTAAPSATVHTSRASAPMRSYRPAVTARASARGAESCSPAGPRSTPTSVHPVPAVTRSAGAWS